MAEEQADSTTEIAKPAARPATYLLFQEPDPASAIRRPVHEDKREEPPRDDPIRSDQDDDDRHRMVIMASPVGRDVNSSMPI